jgi:hypothetical protein
MFGLCDCRNASLAGLLFIFSAPKCRLPRFISTIGIIALVAGAVYFFLGRGRLDSLIQWMFSQPSMFKSITLRGNHFVRRRFDLFGFEAALKGER